MHTLLAVIGASAMLGARSPRCRCGGSAAIARRVAERAEPMGAVVHPFPHVPNAPCLVQTSEHAASGYHNAGRGGAAIDRARLPVMT